MKYSSHSLFRLAAALVLLFPSASRAQEPFRPPAVPLVTFDPYLSIWSEADRLTDDVPRHWTGRAHSLASMVRVDGQAYRLMGKEPAAVPALPQTALQVTPTRSIYRFANEHVVVTLTFMTAALPDNLTAYSRPLSYVTWTVQSTDGAAHNVSLYFSASSQIAVNQPTQQVEWLRERAGRLTTLRAGTPGQGYFDVSGDDARLDWGYLYAAAPSNETHAAIGSEAGLEQEFAARGEITAAVDSRMPRASSDEQPALAFTWNVGHVGAEVESRHAIVAYDEVYAIKYFGRSLRPWWRRNGASAEAMLKAADHDYPKLVAACASFDSGLTSSLTRAGGEEYARMAALAYRQALAACGLAADQNGQPLLFTKENTSNGDIATVDVFYPMDPVFLLLSPTLAKASVVPILSYAASAHWKFPNAPHDLGTYPIARGTDDGGEGMPVEESGNMLLLCDAIAQEEHSPAFVGPWWKQLTQWAVYLERFGNDPEDQLCTDDFMGHLAHNANLSVKAILGLAAYGDLCRMRGDAAGSKRYNGLARQYAAHFMEAARDGEHYRLAFDKPDTWSQKYNLVWDRILGLNVFPASVAQDEVWFYKTVLQPYGLPLDSRTHLTKSDWTIWSATLADSQADFEALTSPLYRYLQSTGARVPFADSYMTDDVNSSGMHARPVIGGVFIKMLADRATWQSWARRDTAHVGGWAPLPPPPVMREVVPTSQLTAQTWRYTTDAPPAGWTAPSFNDSTWKSGPGGFGSKDTPGIVIGTQWTTPDIWLRRSFTMPPANPGHLQIFGFHDEDVEVYVNGVLAAKEASYISAYQPLGMFPAALAELKPGATVTLAVHCHQTDGGQGVDIGLEEVTGQ